MSGARHAARVGGWVLLVCVCLVPVVALLAAPYNDTPRDKSRTTTEATTTTSTTEASTSTAPATTIAPVTVAPGSLTEANDMGDPTFVPGEGGTWTTSSTFYCLNGVTADGSGVADGIVAVSYANWPGMRGSSWRVEHGPADLIGRVFTVHDKGPAAHFDMWTGDCAYARAYGRRTITVVPVT